MGVTTEQWRATVGRWNGGRPAKCVIVEHFVTSKPDNDSYRWFRYLVLVSLLAIGCVELNPGPNSAKDTSAPSLHEGDLPKYKKRAGSTGLHGEMYGIRVASFLFARALHRTEEFHLASNVDGAAGAFDDVVFKYKLKGQDIGKTCFIQLKHKKNRCTIQRCSLKQMSGDFSLFRYFESYCQIKKEASVDSNLKLCGSFDDFEFIIYTNARLQSGCMVGVDEDPVSILSSGPEGEKYVTFNEECDEDIFDFFKQLSRYYNFILELENVGKIGTYVGKEIKEEIENINSTFKNVDISDRLDKLKSKPNYIIRNLIKETEKCDFSLYKDFLQKVKIFQGQENENAFETLIKKELQVACHTLHSGANSIYKKFQLGVKQWWGESGSVTWLSESSHVWQKVRKHWVDKIEELSKAEVQELLEYGIHFRKQHMQPLYVALQSSILLYVITNIKCGTLSKLKIYKALKSSGCENSLFISLKSLMTQREKILKFWQCKWSSVLVIDCEQSSDCVDNNLADIIMGMLHTQKKIILISQFKRQQLATRLQAELKNRYAVYEDNCNLLDLDDKSQKLVLKRTVDFQGTDILLETLVGEDSHEIIKQHIDSDVLSVLLSRKQKLCVGRKLSDFPSCYIPRILEHRIYLTDDILRTTDNTITFAFTGLEPNQLKQYLSVGEKIHKLKSDKRSKNLCFQIVDSFTKPGLVVDLGSNSSQHNVLQSSKPEEVRYVILGKKHPESDFKKLKELCKNVHYKNVHWVHMENSAFVWRESNCGIDVIRKYVDNKRCESYDVKSIMEHSDTTVLLAAEPGMGKSTFLSCLEHEIKKCKPSVWVLRLNLHEHTQILEDIEFEGNCIDKCKEFLCNAAHSAEQNALTLVKVIFRQALEQTGKVVVILDGFDEISPDYSHKVKTLITEIRKETDLMLWVSSRCSYRIELEDTMMKFAFTLRPLTRQNQITFLEEYWNKTIERLNKGRLRNFAEELLKLSSKNFSDKDGQFTGIPLQMVMLGEAFVKEAENYCLNEEVNLPEKFNLLTLFRKFSDKKFDIYFKEKNAMDSSKPQTKTDKTLYIENHMSLAVESLFSPHEFRRLLTEVGTSYFQHTRRGKPDRLGMIIEFTDNKPRFIHRCFAEYFTAMWFTKHFDKCKIFISESLFTSTYEVLRNIFDRMLAEEFSLHCAVLDNGLEAVRKLLNEETDVNSVDKGGRTALHLAASYNSIVVIEKLLSVPGVDVNITDRVLEWTPLMYSYASRSWMAMDRLLQSGGNSDDIMLTKCKIEDQEWGQAALWESARKGYKKLLEFMLSSGFDVNAVVSVRENHQDACVLLHIASRCSRGEVVRFLIERRADVNIRSSNGNTALHFAAQAGHAGIVTLLLDEGVCANVTNIHGETSLHLAALYGNLCATKVLVKRGAALEEPNKVGRTPLMLAAFGGQLEVVRYLVKNGAGVNVCSAVESALLLATNGARFDVMRFLLEQGADINGSNVKRNPSPLQVAVLRQNLHIMRYLIEGGADVNHCTHEGWYVTALHLAALSGNLESMDCLINAGANLNVRDMRGCTPLHYAVVSNNTILALYLVEKGADVNIADCKGRTPLHLSVLNNNVTCVKHFLKVGANINYQDIDKVTALSMAIENRRIHIVNILVENCADVNLRDAFGNTALHVAIAYGDAALVQYLVDRGADVNIPNNSRNTPLHWIAFCRGWDNLAAHLVPHERSLKIDTPLQVKLFGTAKLIRKTGPVMQTPL